MAGALMSYGPNIPTLFRHAADYVDKILRGTKPGELPVEQPTQFDLVTAKALGLTVPHNLLVLAEEVIEWKDASLLVWSAAPLPHRPSPRSRNRGKNCRGSAYWIHLAQEWDRALRQRLVELGMIDGRTWWST
jgi:hypothetical protein